MKLSKTLIVATGLALSAVIAGLIVQNNQLRETLSASRPEPTSSRLEAGDRLPYVELRRDDDAFHVARLDQSGSATALFVFSSECGACQVTLPQWNDLVDETSDSSIQFLGIQVDDSELPRSAEPSFTVLQADPLTADWLKNIPYVPATILLDDEGVVTQVWYGALDDTRYEELRAGVGVSSARVTTVNHAASAAQEEKS